MCGSSLPLTDIQVSRPDPTNSLDVIWQQKCFGFIEIVMNGLLLVNLFFRLMEFVQIAPYSLHSHRAWREQEAICLKIVLHKYGESTGTKAVLHMPGGYVQDK